MINVTLCKKYEDAINIAKEMSPCCAVECEYGDDTIDENIDGVELAFYHHGKHSDKPAPSLRWDVYDQLEKGFDNFIISHIDLDTIMGIMWASKILRPTSIAKEIGKLAAIQDLNGFHFIEKEYLPKMSPTLKYRFIGAGYILSNLNIEDNGENIVDVSRVVHKSILKIKDIIIEGVSEELKNKIDNWLVKKQEDAREAIEFENDSLRFYISDKNLNSAYCIDKKCVDIILQYNESNNAISLSAFNEEIAKKYFGENGVLTPLKDFFGDKAGGRISIGGGPRDKKLNIEHAKHFLNYLVSNYINSNTKLVTNIHI